MNSSTPHYTQIKRVLRRCDLAQEFIPSKAMFSPYRACAHACAYCDGRAEKYYVTGNFESDIVVRSNLADLLPAELEKLREPTIVSIGSGVSDPYQPLEKSEQIMRQSAQILDRMAVPATLLTKSALPMRDLDIWSSLNAKKQFFLVVSLTMLDERLREVFEPGASPVQERLDMIRAFRERGCRVGVLAMPLLPALTDTSENVSELYATLCEIGVDFIMPGGLTLRPGVQKEHFFATLERFAPHLVQQYRHIYRHERQSGVPATEYYRKVQERFRSIARSVGCAPLVPHATYRNLLANYDELYVLLSHMITLYRDRSINTSRLELARKGYVEWFMPLRREWNRKRSIGYRILEEHLAVACRNGSIEQVLGNSKLAHFAAEVVLNRKVFDYVGLRLNAP